jgi:hypothetical protein
MFAHRFTEAQHVEFVHLKQWAFEKRSKREFKKEATNTRD